MNKPSVNLDRRARQVITVTVIAALGLFVLYETLVGRPTSDRQIHDYESVFAHIGIPPGTGFDSESTSSKTGVASLTRCYTLDRGANVIEDFYDDALVADGWTRDPHAEEKERRSEAGFVPRIYRKGTSVATLGITARSGTRGWHYCLTFSLDR